MIDRKTAARLAGAGAAATIALGLCSTGAANADTFVPLPGGEISRTLTDGTVVTVRLVGESANINPSMGSTPMHRNTWVSGSAQVELSGPGVKGGAIYPGYVVGCQVNFGGGGVTGGSVTWSDSTLGLSGCAGYAQARAFVKVKVSTEAVSSLVTLWGQPFSIG